MYTKIEVFASIHIGSVWFPENVRERKLGGKKEGKKKVRK